MTTKTIAVAETALARSSLYAFLGQGLAYPAPERRTLLVERMAPVLAGLEPEDLAVGEAITGCLRALEEADAVSLVRAHQLQFTIIESRDCPTYETAYRGEDVFRQAHIMADVAGCYVAHGLRVGGEERERPDHITVELEFMSFLTAQEAYAVENLGRAEVESARRTQRLFLREHLGTWGPGFGRRVQMTAESNFYGGLGKLLAVWLEAEMGVLGVTPSEAVDRPLPPPPPDDGTCGVASSEAWPVQLQVGRP
ncbi:MAG: molecular chaperone TorD family protein [Nitriliruptorales bacterium]|nr:molecular chaperone TorD family protein [Nitriliruptorales bacterium]